MRTPYKIPELESEHGDLREVIPAMVNEVGQSETAEKLELSQSTISRLMKGWGYVRKTIYVLEESAS